MEIYRIYRVRCFFNGISDNCDKNFVELSAEKRVLLWNFWLYHTVHHAHIHCKLLFHCLQWLANMKRSVCRSQWDSDATTMCRGRNNPTGSCSDASFLAMWNSLKITCSFSSLLAAVASKICSVFMIKTVIPRGIPTICIINKFFFSKWHFAREKMPEKKPRNMHR